MNSPSFRYGRPVTIITQAVIGQDDYGNDVPGPVVRIIPGCSWWPTQGEEITEDRDLIVTGLTVLAPPGTVIAGTDRVVVDGKDYEVQGDPLVWTLNPFTGSSAGVQLTLRRVTG